MNGRSTISVVIPTYNNARFLPDALTSALRQTVPPDEIIVIDDGSTDNTREVLYPFSDRIRYIRTENKGVAHARNLGIRASHRDAIAFLDSDDLWLPTKLESQLQYLADNPSVGLLHSDFLYLDTDSGHIYRKNLSTAIFSGSCYLRFFFCCDIHLSTVVVRKRCFDEVGLFDTDIPGGQAEDMDLWIRISRHSSFGFLPEIHAYYRQHSSNSTRDMQRQHVSVLHVYQKALRSDPAVKGVVGPRLVERTMSRRAFDAAYHTLEQGKNSEARAYFTAAIGYTPLRPKLWVLWVSTFFSPRIRTALRRLRAGISPLARPRSAPPSRPRSPHKRDAPRSLGK